MNSKNEITAKNVAYAFLYRIPEQIAKDGNGINSITLHKLLFFAQEEYLFKYRKPLYKNIIVAKEHGMVAKDVVIDNKDTSTGSNRVEALTFRPQNDILDNGMFSTEAQQIIKYVWSLYGNMSAWYLEQLTHSYSIWKDNVSKNLEVSIDSILKYKQEIEKAKQDEKNKVDKIFTTLEKDIFNVYN